MEITIKVDDQKRFQTLMEWLWTNNFLETASINAFKPASSPKDGDVDKDDFWMRHTEEVLRDDWDAPENDVWDKLYAEQHGQV